VKNSGRLTGLAGSLVEYVNSKCNLTYSIIAWVTSSRGSVSAKTLYSLINAICLNNKIRNYLIKKAKFYLPFLPIITANLKASDALLRR